MNLITEATCGPACWHAKEDECRCSCGGKNHGCLRKEGGEQPQRERWKLEAVAGIAIIKHLGGAS